MLRSIGKTRRMSLTGRTEPLTFENRYKSKDAMNYQRKLSKKALDACRTFKGVGVRKQQLESRTEPRVVPVTADFDHPMQNQLANVNFQEAKFRGRPSSRDPSSFEEKINFEQLPSRSNFRQMYREQGESKGNASQRLLQVMKKNVPMTALPNDTRRRQPPMKKEKSRMRMPSEKVPQAEDDSVSVFFERINNMERDEMQMKLDKQPTTSRQREGPFDRQPATSRQRGSSPPPPRRKSFKVIDEKVNRPKSPPRSSIQLRGENESGDTVPRRSQTQRGDERNKQESSMSWRDSVRQRFGVAPTDGHVTRQTNERQIPIRQLIQSNKVQNVEHKGTNDMRQNGPKHGMQAPVQRSGQEVRPNVQKQLPMRSTGDKHNAVRPSRALPGNTFGNGSTRQNFDLPKHINSERQPIRQERYPSRDKSGEEKYGKRGGREDNRQITPATNFDPSFDPSRHMNERRKTESRPSTSSQGKRSDAVDLIGVTDTNQGRQMMDKGENAKVAVVRDLYPEPHQKRPNAAKPDLGPSRRREEVSRRSLTDSDRGPMMTQKGHHSNRDLNRQDSHNMKRHDTANVDKNDNLKVLPDPQRQRSGKFRPISQPAPSEKENKFDMTRMDNAPTNRRVSMDTAMQTVNTADAVVRTLANSVKPYDAPDPSPNMTPPSTQIVLEFPADMVANFRQSVIHKRVSMDTCKAIVTEEPALVDLPGEPIFKNVQSTKNVVRPSHDRRCLAETIPTSNKSANGGSSTKGGGGSKDASSSKNSSSQQSGSSANTNGRNINMDQYRAYLEQQGSPNRGARVVNVSKRRTQIRNPVQGKKIVPSNIGYQSGPYFVQP